jgi:hypothetical protein
MFIAGLLKTAKLWKQLRCPTTDKWIKKMWYLYIMEFYSTTKKNEIFVICRQMGRTREHLLSEVSQVQKAKNHMFSLIHGIQSSYKHSNIMKHWSHYGEVTHRRGRAKEGN